MLAALIGKHVREAERVVFETGPLSIRFFHALTAEGSPAICIDARHAKAALDMAANKTHANDAGGLARLVEVGFYKEVRVKSFDSTLARTLMAARTHLVRSGTELVEPDQGFDEDVRPRRTAPRVASSSVGWRLCRWTMRTSAGSSGH